MMIIGPVLILSSPWLLLSFEPVRRHVSDEGWWLTSAGCLWDSELNRPAFFGCLSIISVVGLSAIFTGFWLFRSARFQKVDLDFVLSRNQTESPIIKQSENLRWPGLEHLYEDGRQLFLRGQHDEAVRRFKRIYEDTFNFKDVAEIIDDIYLLPREKWVEKYQAKFQKKDK